MKNIDTIYSAYKPAIHIEKLSRARKLDLFMDYCIVILGVMSVTVWGVLLWF